MIYRQQLVQNIWRVKRSGFWVILSSFKALEVSYNFFRNSLLYKTHGFFLIPKIPPEGQNCQKWTSSKNDLLVYFHFKLLQNYPKIIKILEFDHSCLRFIKDSRNVIFYFWCEMTVLPLVLFLHNFCPLSKFNT